MVTLHGQEWLRGLRDTDTDPNSLHIYFVSRRATCLQPRVHIWKPILHVMCHYQLSRESREARKGGRDAVLLFSSTLLLFSITKWRRGPPDDAPGQAVFSLVNTRLWQSLRLQSHTSKNHTLTFPHWWACCVASLMRHSGPNSSKGQLIFKQEQTGSVSQGGVGPLWHCCDFMATVKWIIGQHNHGERT